MSAHAMLPWSSLCAQFEHRRGGRDPGPQAPNLYARGQPGQVKAFEYFARALQTRIRNHAHTERRKHHPPQDYTQRAQRWKTKRPAAGNEEPEWVVVSPGTETAEDENEVRRRRNVELRALQSRLADWGAQPESRQVFTDEFAARHPPRPHSRFGIAPHLQSIENWSTEADEGSDYHARQKARVERTEALTLLVIELACTPSTDESYQDQIETLLLLVHHPNTQFENTRSDSVSCCNMFIGPRALLERTLYLYILLNMLRTYASDAKTANGSLFASIDIEPYGPPSYTKVAPKIQDMPAFMDCACYRRVMHLCTSLHDGCAELALFVPFLTENNAESPIRPGFNPLSDADALSKFLQSLFRTLVILDILFTEHGEHAPESHRVPRYGNGKGPRYRINWEYAVLEALETIFGNWVRVNNLWGIGREGTFNEYSFRRAQMTGKGWNSWNLWEDTEDEYLVYKEEE